MEHQSSFQGLFPHFHAASIIITKLSCNCFLLKVSLKKCMCVNGNVKWGIWPGPLGLCIQELYFNFLSLPFFLPGYCCVILILSSLSMNRTKWLKKRGACINKLRPFCTRIFLENGEWKKRACWYGSQYISFHIWWMKVCHLILCHFYCLFMFTDSVG